MAKSYNSQANPGLFIPTTNVWDPSIIKEIKADSPEFKELIVRLYQNINNIALALNLKDSGYYVQEEFLNGQLFFPNPALNSNTAQSPTYRQVFRSVVNFGALPNTGTTNQSHGISVPAGYSGFSFTRIYGCATDTSGSYIPIPFASPVLNENIKLTVNNTQVSITTGSNRSNYTKCYVVLEYLKN